jgi:hypothetical protein
MTLTLDTMPRKIVLYASQIAACAGRHPFMTQEMAAVRYLRDRHYALWKAEIDKALPEVENAAKEARETGSPAWMRVALDSHDKFKKRTTHGIANESCVLANAKLPQRLRCKEIRPDGAYREKLLFTHGE